MRVIDNVGFNVKKQEIPGGGSGNSGGGNAQPLATPDWNQNDETAADYIKNRPFYDESLVFVPYFPGEEDWGWYKVSDQIPTGDIPKKNDYCYVSDNGVSGYTTIFEVGNNYYMVNETRVIVALSDNVEIDGTVFPEKGTYFIKIPDFCCMGFALGRATEFEFTWDGNTGTIKKIEEKYIPEMNSVILKSTTSDSTKKFAITVDDTGTLTATEVTG